MKKLISLVLCIATFLFVSCQKEEPKTQKETGHLHINIGLFVNVNEVTSVLKSTAQTENFRVTIYKSDGSEVLSFENAIEMPEFIELETGAYYVEAHSDNNLPAAFENPFYLGVSDPFTIDSNAQQAVLVNCRLANTIVTVTYSSNIVSSFSDYSTTVSSVLDSLVFTSDETRMGYFQTSPLDITVRLSFVKPDGLPSSKILTGSIPDPLPNRHYEIAVDASIGEGMATFQILLDETAVLVEVVDISEDSNPQPNGAIGYGELLITEIMYNPTALTDTEGEWFEIYNNSDHSISLQNLILKRDNTNTHIITDPFDLAPSAYFVFERSDLATGALDSYLYGSAITLSNTGAVLAIYNEGTETDPGALIFSVDYGGAGFPDGTAASISLNPTMLNPSDAILGTSWCISSSVYGAGDLGTPGLANDLCL